MRRLSLLSIWIAFLVLTSEVGARQLSSIPGSFVDVGVGAKGAGMGFAGTATLQGAEAVNWNVAAVYPSNGLEAGFSYVDQLGLINYGHFSLALPLRTDRNVVALSVQYSGDDAPVEESIHISYAHRLSTLWMGIGLGYRKAIYGKNVLSSDDYVIFDGQEVAEGVVNQISGQASGYVVDAGIKLLLSSDLTFGVSAKNIRSPIHWNSYSGSRSGTISYVESVPMEISTGIHYKLSDHLQGAIDWVPTFGSDAQSRIGFGVSFNPVEAIALRTGRMIFQDGYKNEVTTFGFGVQTPKSFGIQLQANYAYVASPIAHTQQISLIVGL
ncbi:MAG: hypothetical protein O3B41_08710 [Bacteroidetes bacterium]|nr:hypothetical protein [Bacteroidota bacterium]